MIKIVYYASRILDEDDSYYISKALLDKNDYQKTIDGIKKWEKELVLLPQKYNKQEFVSFVFDDKTYRGIPISRSNIKLSFVQEEDPGPKYYVYEFDGVRVIMLFETLIDLIREFKLSDDDDDFFRKGLTQIFAKNFTEVYTPIRYDFY